MKALGKRYPLLFIFITVFVDLLSYGIIIPLLPFYVQSQDGGAAIVGSLGSLYAVMQLFSGPLLGTLSDRHGRRPVLLGCLLGTSVAYLILGLAGSLSMIFLAIMLDGITGGNLTTAYAYIADSTSPKERSRGMGLVGAAFGLGIMIGPALGGLLSRYGLDVPAFAASGIALANVVFGWLVLPESLPPERRTTRTSWRALNSFSQLASLFSMVPIRLLLATIFTLNLAFSGLQTNFPLYSQTRFGWNATQIGIFFAYVGVCAVLVQGVLFRLVQPRLGEKRLATGGLALMALGLAGMAAAEQAWLMYPLVGMVALGSGLSIPALTGLTSSRVEAGAQGRLMGGMQALLSLTMIIGPSLAGVTFEFIGTSAPYWLGSLLSAAALALAYTSLRGANSNVEARTATSK
jgi:DHA1 family tetracycline resistance protein-like MFS transporter